MGAGPAELGVPQQAPAGPVSHRLPAVHAGLHWLVRAGSAVGGQHHGTGPGAAGRPQPGILHVRPDDGGALGRGHSQRRGLGPGHVLRLAVPFWRAAGTGEQGGQCAGRAPGAHSGPGRCPAQKAQVCGALCHRADGLLFGRLD